MTPANFYTLTPLSGECGKQLVLGYRDAFEIARDISKREQTDVIIRNEKDMLSWIIEWKAKP